MAASGAHRTERPFIGRPEIFDALRRRGDSARAGRGGLSIVEGDPGVGKSILLRGVIAEARQHGMPVMVGRALSLDNPPPFTLIRDALSPAAGARSSSVTASGNPLAFVPGAAGGAVMIGFAGHAGGLGLGGALPIEQRLLETISGPGEPADASRGRLFAQLTDQLLDLAHNSPTLLVLEDVHLADEPSIEFLEYLAPQLSTHPLWVIATTLSVGLLPDRRRAGLDRVAQAGEAELLTVRPFTPGELVEFVREVGGAPVGADEITRWHSQTGGNPQFVEQLMRTRKEGPQPGAPGGVESMGPPELTQYLARQLPTLAEDEHRAMSVASVLGRGFPFALLLRASGEDEERLAEITEHLVRKGILREREDEDLEFVRDDLRAEIYRSLTDTRRRLLHKKAGEALESTGPADVSTIFALARHYYLGKVDDRASEYNRLAAEFAARSMSSAVAREHFERALESHRRARPDDHTGELEITLELAVQLDRLGELNEAEATLRAALERPELLSSAGIRDRTLLGIYLARILTDEGRWDEADRLTQEIDRTLAPGQATPLAQIALHRLRGEVLYYRGRYAESLGEHDAALRLATKLGNEREVALEMVRRANVLGMFPDRLAEAIRDYRRATQSLIDLGDKGQAAYALLFLGVVLSQHDRTDEGLRELDQALALAEEAHDLRQTGWALFNLADLLREKGQIEPAIERNRRSREILSRIGDRFGLAQTLIVGGKILLMKGDLAAAELELLEAFRLVRELNAPADELDVVLRLAELAQRRGDLAQARGRVSELAAREIVRIRPDLAADFVHLRGLLDQGEGRSGSSSG